MARASTGRRGPGHLRVGEILRIEELRWDVLESWVSARLDLGRRDGQADPLPVDLPLGISPDTLYRSTDLLLQPGDRLVLVTDGMLERKTATLDLGPRSPAVGHASAGGHPAPDRQGPADQRPSPGRRRHNAGLGRRRPRKGKASGAYQAPRGRDGDAGLARRGSAPETEARSAPGRHGRGTPPPFPERDPRQAPGPCHADARSQPLHGRHTGDRPVFPRRSAREIDGRAVPAEPLMVRCVAAPPAPGSSGRPHIDVRRIP